MGSIPVEGTTKNNFDLELKLWHYCKWKSFALVFLLYKEHYMSKKKFHYTTVLGVMHNRIISDNEPYDLLTFLVGYTVTVENYTKAREECLPYLCQKFPILGDITAIEAFRVLDDIQDGDVLCDAMVMAGWLAKNSQIFLAYNEMIEIEVDTEKVSVNTSKRRQNIIFLHETLKKLGMN
jgi:hypothetical protein